MVRVGASQSVVVKADDNLIDRVTTEVKSGTLVIGNTPDSFSTKSPMSVEVTIPRLNALTLTGSGNIVVDDIEAERLKVDLPGSGTLTGTGTATRLDVTVGGSGVVQFTQLVAKDVRAAVEPARGPSSSPRRRASMPPYRDRARLFTRAIRRTLRGASPDRARSPGASATSRSGSGSLSKGGLSRTQGTFPNTRAYRALCRLGSPSSSEEVAIRLARVVVVPSSVRKGSGRCSFTSLGEFIDTSEDGIRFWSRSMAFFSQWQPPAGAEFKGGDLRLSPTARRRCGADRGPKSAAALARTQRPHGRRGCGSRPPNPIVPIEESSAIAGE